MKIYLIVFLGVLGAGMTPLYSQVTPENTAGQFVTAAFITEKPAKEIADKYMHFQPLENFSFKKRIKALKYHIKKLKKEKPELSDSSNFSFARYTDYNQDKVPFKSEAFDNIVILLSADKPLLYLYLENDKIVSFDYIQKGDLAFFITY